MPLKVSFLVDGFNLYYSLRQMEGLSKNPVRWLDLWNLCDGYLSSIRNHVGEKTELAAVHYFSAYAWHRAQKDPGAVERHQTYVAAPGKHGCELRDVAIQEEGFQMSQLWKAVPSP